MKNFKIAAVLVVLGAGTGCGEKTNLSDINEDSYESSKAVNAPMTFPAGASTVYKEFFDYKKNVMPKPYAQPDTWVVYMAAPGWTNGGLEIENRLASDASAISRVKAFIEQNGLRDKVKVAWLQYDINPAAPFLEPLEKVPSNFIPLHLKFFGPASDYYIYSPAARFTAKNGQLRYDLWIKQYVPYAEKVGDDYKATTFFQENAGFNDLQGPYWDNWARHWFIVNPEGTVVDAYFSNLGHYYIQGPDKPISSLIHHFDLDADDLIIPKLINTRYKSLYTKPYWEKINNDLREDLGFSSDSQ